MGDTFAPNFSLFHQPIVQVIAKSVAKKYYNGQCYKVHTLNVVDGDDKMVVVKVNTVLNDSVGLIQSGGVVQLTDYAPLYFHYKNYQQINNVVLLNNFSISDLPVWNIPSEFEDMPPPESRLRTSEEDENCAAFAARMRKNATELGNGGGGSGEGGGGASGGGDGGDESHGADGLDVCDGQLCSRYGIMFHTCITRILPPNEQILETIVRENPFVTKGVEEMDAGERRFCYYYWYMTNVYFITGNGNSREVPPCLENECQTLTVFRRDRRIQGCSGHRRHNERTFQSSSTNLFVFPLTDTSCCMLPKKSSQELDVAS
jgi:hypothetical protein